MKYHESRLIEVEEAKRAISEYFADDVPSEERRFHEFGPIESEAEQWLEESTCHRNRLTVNDTLIKETLIRRIGEEVEEEALEDEEEFDEDLEDEEEEDQDEEDINEDSDEDADEGASDEDVSDAGFQTDDEEGFAVSDSENEDDSDNEWWTAGRSTAATSTDHLEHLRTRSPAIVGRAREGHTYLDLRAVDAADDGVLIDALRRLGG